MDIGRAFWLLVAVAFACWLDICLAIEGDLTIELAAGKRECFYQFVTAEGTIEIEYQVIEGGDLDINFVMTSPSGKILVTDVRKTDNLHRIEPKEAGDVKFCLDNTFSRFSTKLVFFEVITDDPDPNWPKLEELQNLEEEATDGLVDMKMDDFKDVMSKVKQHLDKSISTQNFLRVHESRHRSVAESNFERVNWWSGIQCFVMVSVSLTQVLMIRSLFEDKSKMSQIFKMKT